MRTIHAPKIVSNDRPDAVIDCCYSLEPAFVQLIERGEDAGWRREELLRAVELLAKHVVPDEAGAAC